MTAGTMVMVTLGNGSKAQAVLSLHNKGSPGSVSVGWGLGAGLGGLVAGGVSGAHLNPALTLGLATVGRLPWRKVGDHKQPLQTGMSPVPHEC